MSLPTNFADVCSAVLKNPDEYRPVPFWSWNDELEPQELVRQINLQKEAGIGGYFMHARCGLKTEYMSESWFDCIDACIEEGKRIGMDSWLYDENGWPSGFANGAVPEMGEEYRQKRLVFEETEASRVGITCDTLGLYEIDDGYKMVCDHKMLQPGTKLLHISRATDPYYIDVMNHKVVRAFIDHTYETYFKRFGHEFGDAVPGIFTDEPQLHRPAFVWSDILPAAFYEKYGYELLPVLGMLYGRPEGYEKVRYDFWNLAGSLFESAYSKQIGDWCRAHNLKWTGHYHWEEQLLKQTLSSGGMMRHYKHLDIPGVDWLGPKVGENAVTLRQLASAAAQTGKTRVISEMFGGSGWEMGLSDMKRIAEWHIVNGINMICPHLQPYSVRGERKKDWPPAVFYQNALWPWQKALYDRLTGLCGILASGVQYADILIVHPLKSMFVAADMACNEFGCNDEAATLEKQFSDLCRWVYHTGCGFHFGDEDMLAEMGVAKDGLLTIGQRSYGAVLIPPCSTLDAKTIALLLDFAAQGGQIIAMRGLFPALVDARHTPEGEKMLEELSLICEHVEFDRDAVAAEVLNRSRQAARLEAPKKSRDNLHFSVWEYADGICFYLLNTGSEPAKAEISLASRATVQAVLIDEKIHLGQPLFGDSVAVTLPPNGSELCFARFAEKKAVDLLGWQPAPREPNVLVLDKCRYRISGGQWSAPMNTGFVQKKLLAEERDVVATLEFVFEARDDIKGDAWLAIESGSYREVRVNGHLHCNTPDGWWLDRSIDRLEISRFLRRGENIISIEVDFKNSEQIVKRLRNAKIYPAELNTIYYDTEIEPIFLLGDFGVYSESPFTRDFANTLVSPGPFYIGHAPNAVSADSLVSCGFPFYRGGITLKKSLAAGPAARYGKISLELSAPDAPVATLSANGERLKTHISAPFVWDIPNIAGQDEICVELELVLTNRNTLGNLHFPPVEVPFMATRHFDPENFWQEEYRVIEAGVGKISTITAYPEPLQIL